jgi:NADPH:quinone reductase-like Zn-dependent oxidoreductase
VHLVRRQEQVDELRALGADQVIDTSRPDADAEMKRIFRELGVTIAFDAVAGDLTGRLLAAMPRGGRVIVLGALSEAATPIDPAALIFGVKGIEGFWLAHWMKRAPAVERARAALAVQTMPELKSEVRAKGPLADAARAIADYSSKMTGGKLLLVP